MTITMIYELLLMGAHKILILIPTAYSSSSLSMDKCNVYLTYPFMVFSTSFCKRPEFGLKQLDF